MSNLIIATSVSQLDRLIDRTQKKIDRLSDPVRISHFQAHQRRLLNLRARRELQDARKSRNIDKDLEN
jgi:hypothetical protein